MTDNSDLRKDIVGAFDILLSRQDISLTLPETFNSLMKTLEARLSAYGDFSVLQFVYGYFVSFAKSPDMQIDHKALLHTKRQLLGKEPYWNTYLINHDLAKLLAGEGLRVYQEILLLIDKMNQTGNTNLDECRQLKKAVEKNGYLIYVNTLPELLVAHLANILGRLPNQDPAVYDPLGVHELPYRLRYSSIRPKESTVSVQAQLDYCVGMLRKLAGEEILFVDVHLMSDGYLINLR